MKSKTVALGAIAVGMIAASPMVANAASKPSSHTTPAVGTPAFQYAKTTITVVGHGTLSPEHIVANDPWSGKATSWVPVYYLQESLSSIGVTAKWDGDTLNIASTPPSWKLNVSSAPSVGNPPVCEMQFSIGGNQNEFLRSPKLVAKDPASGVETTYVPVYYADLFLQQRLGMATTWGGSTWSLSAPLTYTPPTSISSVIIDSDSAASVGYVPQSSETASVSQQILSWLQSATTTTIDLPPSTPGLSFGAYVGPSRLLITTANKSQVTIYPAYTITAVGNQGRYKVNYESNVVAYVEGNQTVYLNAPQLYTWLKDDQWQTEFTSQAGGN